MSSDDDANAARREITQLLHDYCELVDAVVSTGDWEKYGAKWVELFAKEGVFHEGPKPFTPHKHGAKVMKGMGLALKAASHQVTNVNIKMDEKETGVAWSDAKFYGWHRPRKDNKDSGELDFDVWGNYKDKLVREGGVWKFAYRFAKIVAQRGGDPLPRAAAPQIEMPESLSSRL